MWILPFLEQEQVHRQLDLTSWTVGFLGPDFLGGNAHNRGVLYGADFPVMFCPGSHLARRGCYNAEV